MSLSDLTLVLATPEQGRQSTTNVYKTWGETRGVQTLEAYHALIDELDDPKQPWAGDKASSWALVPRADPTTQDMLAHVDTYRRTALVRHNGVVTERTTYIVASVFTPEKHRKKGYARHMLSLLHYVLADRETLPPFPEAWGAPPADNFGDAAFSVLYSDVGPTFYEACTKGDSQPGWVSDLTPKRVFPVPEGEAAPDNWGWLDVKGVGELEDLVSDRMRAEFALGPNAVAILPQGGWYRWYPTRNEAMARAAGRDGRRHITRCGVRVPSGGYVVYTPEAKNGVVRLVIGSLQLPVSFDEIASIARREGAEAIELWGGYSGWDGNQHSLEVDHHIPGLAEYGIGQVRWERCEQ